MARHVRKGDQVIVTSGSHKGKVGTIVRVIAKRDEDGSENPDTVRVVVKGVNLRTKHLKPTRINPQGGIVTREAPIHISNVSPVVDGKPTRVRFETRADGSKVRLAARNGQELGVVRGPEAKKTRPAGKAPAKTPGRTPKKTKAAAAR